MSEQDWMSRPANERSVEMAHDIRNDLQEFVNANAEHFKDMDFVWVNKLIEHVLHKSVGLFVAYGLDCVADDLNDNDVLVEHTLSPEQVGQMVRWLRFEAELARVS